MTEDVHVELMVSAADAGVASDRIARVRAKRGADALDEPVSRELSADERAQIRRWLEIDATHAIAVTVSGASESPLAAFYDVVTAVRDLLADAKHDLAAVVEHALPLLVRRSGEVTVTTNRVIVLEPETTTLFRPLGVRRRRLRRRPA